MDSLNDLNYIDIVKNYINNEKFQKIKYIEQHGITRYEHSIKVSYYSYKIAKLLHLDYEQAAIGGLLHDFFLSPEDWSKKDRVKSYFVHPKFALETAMSEFDLTVKEQDMIRSHMFPVNVSVPKYMESWIVSLVDKGIAADEFAHKFRFKLKYAYSLVFLFIVGIIK